MTKTHDRLVRSQFGPRAQAYVASAVHAGGADLDAIAGLAARRRPARAIDLGCGGGHVSFALAAHAGSVDAVDLSDDMLQAVAAEAARRGLGNIVTHGAGVEALPFPDATFDLVASRFSAHHWPDLAAGLREARRVIKPDGVAILADVVSLGSDVLDTHLQAIELLRDPSHARNRTPGEWLAALAAAGFQPLEVTTARLRLDFASWIERMRTPVEHAAAIRSLQMGASEPVRRHFAIEPDGSFTLDTMVVSARPA